MKKILAYSDTDVKIGSFLKEQRNLCGLSQKGVAEHLGITPQQFHKYESGRNHITVSMFARLADILGPHIWDYIKDLNNNEQSTIDGNKTMMAFRYFGKLDAKQQYAVMNFLRELTK